MSLSGLGAVVIWHDLLAEAKPDFYEWHNREHMPERVGIPGFRRGRRYIALRGSPEYFNLYEADSREVLAGQDYLNRLNAPTAWTRRVIPSFRNVARSICSVAYTSGVGSGGIMLTARIETVAGERQPLIDALAGSLLPPLSLRVGVSGVHLCVADEAASRIETAEKSARNNTTMVPSLVVLIEGNSAFDVERAFGALISGPSAFAAAAADTSVYRLEFTRLKTPSSAG